MQPTIRALLLIVVLSGCGPASPIGTERDPQLQHELMHAFAADPVRFDEGYPQLACAIVTGEMTVERFRITASRVPGWEAIAVVGPYNEGRSISGHPLLVGQGEDVCSFVADVEGWVNDSIYDLTLIRESKVVGRLWLRMDGSLPGSFVVGRE